MSITLDPPSIGPQDQPAPVSLVKDTVPVFVPPQPVPAVQYVPEPEEEPAPSWATQLKARLIASFAEDGAVRAHLLRARANTWSWMMAEQVTDEQLVAEILAQRERQHEAREKHLRHELSRVARQLVEHKVAEARRDAEMRSASGRHTEGHEHGRHRDTATDASLRRRQEELEVELEEHGRAFHLLKLDPSAAEVGRARWGRRGARAAALVGAVVGGGIYLPLQDPMWLLASLPAAAVALWRAGIPVDGQEQAGSGQPVPAASPATGIPAQAAPVDQAPAAADAQWPTPEQAHAQAQATEDGKEGQILAVVTVPGTLPADPTMPPAGTFPIARVTTAQWAGECIRRALVKERIPVAEIFDVAQQPWGWTCKVRISEGTPAAIIKAAPDIETLLDLEQGRFIPTPTKRRAVIDLKVAHTDPFAFVPGPARRAPRSLSLKDRPVLGYAMDARPLEMSLYGVQGAVVAGSGGGKSATIRTLAEYLTACRDVVVVALDPSGVGLGPLADAAALTLTSKEEIEAFLRGMHQVSLKRPELLGRLKMGTEWQPSERWPALVAIGDEWPQTTDASKVSGEGIMLTGRKVCTQLLLASQFATADYVGSAIISNLSLQILGPCRQPDVTATFGGGAIDDGWLAHRLVPKQADELNDCGRFFLRGGGYNEPIIWRGNWYDDQTCLELAEERNAAGVQQLDEESLRFGGREFTELFERRGTVAKAKKKAATGGDRILTDVVEVLRAAGLDRARTETLARLLQEKLPTEYAGITGPEVGDRLRKAGAGGTVKIGAVDGMANANGYRLSDLVEALDVSL